MIRRSLALVLIVTALAGASARAEGGDIIIVEPNPAKAAEAANTDASQALTSKNRGFLVRMVSYGCTRKARTTPDFIALSERHGGKDIAAPYCQCFAANMIDKLTADNIKTIIRTRKPDPAMQQAMIPIASQCLEEATGT